MTDPDRSPETVRASSPASEERPKRARAAKPAKAPTAPKARRFEAYADTFAAGIERACGIPCTPPQVHGPRDPLVLLMRTHGFVLVDGRKVLLEGDVVLAWLEGVAHDYRCDADARTYAFGGWTPKGLSRWLSEGRPRAQSTGGAAHIQVRRG
jgi:hypothetical protein